MAGGNFFGPQTHGVVQERLELDFGVAQNVRVGCAARLIFAQKLGKDALFIFRSEIDVFNVDANHVGHGRSIDKIDVGRAVLAVVVIFPVFHEDADHLVPLLFQQVGRDRGIHTATQAHHNSLFTFTHTQVIIPATSRERAQAQASPQPGVFADSNSGRPGIRCEGPNSGVFFP